MMRRMFKKAAALILGAAMTVTMGTSAFATGWQKNDTGWWYGTNSDNTTWYANEWQWIDAGNNRAYCYYFDANGYMLANTMTPDGYYVDADGRWVTDLGLVNGGVVQTKVIDPWGGMFTLQQW